MGTLTLCPSYKLYQRFGSRHEIVIAPGTVETTQNSSIIDKSNGKIDLYLYLYLYPLGSLCVFDRYVWVITTLCRMGKARSVPIFC